MQLYTLESLSENLKSLIAGTCDDVSVLANSSSLIYLSLPDINWAGFYILKDGALILGPFQGKPACIKIPLGKGVCGTAANAKKTVVVPDVHKFPGHIACDGSSNSEIVVPLFKNGKFYGVLDIDSPVIERFGVKEQEILEKCAEIIGESLIE